MEVFNRKDVTYFILKFVKSFLIDEIKSILFDGKFVNCVFNGYPRGRNGYELLAMELGGLKFINHKCITFSESYKGNKSKDVGMKILETMAEKTRFEVKVPLMNTISSERRIIDTYDYHLTHIKVMRKIVPSQRENYVYIECYALNMDERLQNSEA